MMQSQTHLKKKNLRALNGKKKPRDWLNDPSRCALCGNPEQPELGVFFKSTHTYSVHQYCMFFASSLEQNGGDDEGYDGYMPDDIKKTVLATRNVCKVCNYHGATAGCSVKSCRMVYHYPCGVKDGALFQFFGCFDVYCFEHRPFQIRVMAQPTANTDSPRTGQCIVCKETLMVDCYQNIWTPCCKHAMHRECIQNFAYSCGSMYFRCPVCNDKKLFIREMEIFGIFIPHRDASWEGDAMYEFDSVCYLSCKEVNCRCPEGRQYSVSNSPWDIVACTWCGSSGSHRACVIDQEIDTNHFSCSDCRADSDAKLRHNNTRSLDIDRGSGSVETKDSSNDENTAIVTTKRVNYDENTFHDIFAFGNMISNTQSFLRTAIEAMLRMFSQDVLIEKGNSEAPPSAIAPTHTNVLPPESRQKILSQNALMCRRRLSWPQVGTSVYKEGTVEPSDFHRLFKKSCEGLLLGKIRNGTRNRIVFPTSYQRRRLTIHVTKGMLLWKMSPLKAFRSSDETKSYVVVRDDSEHGSREMSRRDEELCKVRNIETEHVDNNESWQYCASNAVVTKCLLELETCTEEAGFILEKALSKMNQRKSLRFNPISVPGRKRKRILEPLGRRISPRTTPSKVYAK